MLFFVHYKDKEHCVRVEARLGKTHVKFDNEDEVIVDLHYYGNDCSFIHHDKVFAANVSRDKHSYTIWRPDGNLCFTVESEYRRLVGLLRGQTMEEERNVYAKMPGKIVKIMAKVGDTVDQGMGVIIMEAMKMENEIRVSITGEVKTIHVKEGQAVETGTLLMELTPTD